MSICPICQSELNLVLLSKPSGSISRYECWSCSRYLLYPIGRAGNLKTPNEVIINDDGKWWIIIGRDIFVIDRASDKLFATYPLVPMNYQNPQETIDKLNYLKAFI